MTTPAHDCTTCTRGAAQGCTAHPTWQEFNGVYLDRLCPGWDDAKPDLPRYPTEVIQAAFGRVTGSWPEALRSLGMRRVAAGNEAHRGEDVAALDLPGEALEEALDVAGYAGLAKLTGRWSWRWGLAVWLAGWIARLMLAERGRAK